MTQDIKATKKKRFWAVTRFDKKTINAFLVPHYGREMQVLTIFRTKEEADWVRSGDTKVIPIYLEGAK